jgi:hypothetical protein
MINATTYLDADGDPAIKSIFRLKVRIDACLGRLWEADRQLHHLDTHTVLLTDRPVNARQRREHAVSRVLYTWLRREEENAEAAAADIETLLPLGRTDRWKNAVRTWAAITRTDPRMFLQHSIFTNYAAE